VHFLHRNDAEIFPAHYKWKVAKKEFKMAFMMNKLAMINSFEIILEKKFQKIHCVIQVHTILICTLYLIKYGTFKTYTKVLWSRALGRNILK